MKSIFKYFLIIIIFSTDSYSSPIYNHKIQKGKIFQDKRIPWIFSFPYDFQYRIFKEGIFWNFEGINIGIFKLFIRTATIKNNKKISIQKFKENFFICQHNTNSFIKKNKIQNPQLTFYRICTKESYFLIQFYFYLSNKFFLLYIAIPEDIQNNDKEKIISFINKIQISTNYQ